MDPPDGNAGGVKFDELLLTLRKRADMTQEQLSEASGVSHQTISNIERGSLHRPRKTTILQLATALGLDGAAKHDFEEAARRWSRKVEPLPEALSPLPATHVEPDEGPRTVTGWSARRRWQPAMALGLIVLVAGLWWVSRSHEGTTADSTPTYVTIPLGTVNARPALITASPDGALWFALQYGDAIWKLPRGGKPTEALKLAPGAHPFGITTAPDGGIWFTEGEADGTSGDAVGKLRPDGTLAHRTQFPVGSQPTGITVAPDGRVWVTAYGEKAVYWVSPDGQTMGGPFRVGGNPNRVIVGPDNNIWVTIATSPHVVVLSPQGLPVREFLVFPGPTDIAVGRDGKVWITSHNSNRLQWIDHVTGQTSEGREVLGGPAALVIGPDGNLWVTQIGGRSISAISPAGDIVRIVPISGGTPFGIANGPDGAIWFTVWGAQSGNSDAIGRIALRR